MLYHNVSLFVSLTSSRFFRWIGDIFILISVFIVIYSGIETIEILANETTVVRQELSCIDYFQVG